MITLKEVNNLKKTAKIVTFHQKQIDILVSNLLSKPLFLSKISSYVARFLKKKKGQNMSHCTGKQQERFIFWVVLKFSLSNLYIVFGFTV